MKELVVVSGKGGTGKTSISASLAVLAGKCIVVDCDVDAADMHLLLTPEVSKKQDFISGHQAFIREEYCTGCGICYRHCRFDAVERVDMSRKFVINEFSCEGCGLCVRLCPAGAISFPERLCGVWMESETRCGPMFHAKLAPAAENSGKLVALLKAEARRKAEESGVEVIIVDGSPGIGCPTIAALSGASAALVVIEPTVSGEHDLLRILELIKHFKIPAAVCVNKCDINPEVTQRIEKIAQDNGTFVAAKIRYSKNFTENQINSLTVVETPSEASKEIRELWETQIKPMLCV
ncbi:Cobyrinic acid ac-diamide synthase [Denitrovibrio acetiphilus DSM 12809]|uniref:Cobyrinic acid ac-diamide synthase n=1 Tax=Denitrovibrio acetiphilus (strain DSM 12809 / NBRC 114555 / N2460) TaxID=522772 RepID=D4H810_DENA2|nr:ATP-binding protein [Denitrovibrio acetiphilus]ADD68159.1 Cobyrinic acid ac-diamide synthase [Denitrovibrio acetiphilus DSM 12809]